MTLLPEALELLQAGKIDPDEARNYLYSLNNFERIWFDTCAERYLQACLISDVPEDPRIYWEWFKKPLDVYTGQISDFTGMHCIFPPDTPTNHLERGLRRLERSRMVLAC
jgi:hypothetical protein